MSEFTEPIPRICIFALVPGCPLVLNTCTPGISPSRAVERFEAAFFCRLSTETLDAEPVNEFFVAVP